MQATLDRRDVPTRRRFDVGAYYRMADTGILAPKERVELIDGAIVEMAPIGSAHAGTTNRLTGLVERLASDGCVVASVRSPLRLDPFNEPQPDLMLLCPRADDYTTSHPTATDVLLLVEVADGSLAWDRGPKLDLYARHAVPEVWIVDLPGRAVEVCRGPGLDGYAERRRLTAGMVAPTLVPGIEIDVAALLA
jgi:Uma2 family endonuclease